MSRVGPMDTTTIKTRLASADDVKEVYDVLVEFLKDRYPGRVRPQWVQGARGEHTRYIRVGDQYMAVYHYGGVSVTDMTRPLERRTFADFQKPEEALMFFCARVDS